MISFDKIVKKLGKRKGEFLDIRDIGEIIDPDFAQKNISEKSTVYKIIYRLKAVGIVFPIRQGLYFVHDGRDRTADMLVEEEYWKIVGKILRSETGGNYYISSNKAIELHMRDYSATRKLIVYNPNISKNIRLSKEYSISFRTLRSGKKTNNSNLFGILKKHTLSFEIDGVKIQVSGPELSILDALLMRDESEGIDRYLIEKYLKRSNKALQRELLGSFVSLKYITSINRLKEIAKSMRNDELYSVCLDIIKNEGGGCFISE